MGDESSAEMEQWEDRGKRSRLEGMRDAGETEASVPGKRRHVMGNLSQGRGPRRKMVTPMEQPPQCPTILSACQR